MKNRDRRRRWAGLLLCAAAGCAKAYVDPGPRNAGASGAPADTGGSGGGFMLPTGDGSGGYMVPDVTPCAATRCNDFPAAPIIDDGTPADVAAAFTGGGAAGTGLCLAEPQDGTLFPNNWLRPRIAWSGPPGPYRITVHAEHEGNDLVAYTTKTAWALPKDVWKSLSTNLRGADISVTVRAASGDAGTATFRIAPAGAGGSVVFWAATPSEVGKDPVKAMDADSELRGFTVGDESTVPTLRMSQVKQPSRWQDWNRTRTVKCIGCHVATPDNAYVAFIDHWPWNSAIAGVKPGVTGAMLPGLGAGGLLALNMPWAGMPTFSKAHWETGKRIMVVTSSLRDPRQPTSTDDKLPARLLWYDLDAPAPPASTAMNGQLFPVLGQQFGVIARTGDERGAACPTWSHDGNRIVYSSTMGGNMDGRLELGATDLYTVPYGDGQGGPAKPIPGAAEKAFEEYYPAFSPDDRLLVYDRVPSGERMYANKNAELFVVPADGGQATRLRANDPAACTGMKSPGVNNHFAKWSPAFQTFDGKTYYWLIFSSNRAGLAPVTSPYLGGSQVQVSQLYMTAVVQSLDGKVETYPAVYLWNQSTATVNTTPLWESLDIPRIVD